MFRDLYHTNELKESTQMYQIIDTRRNPTQHSGVSPAQSQFNDSKRRKVSQQSLQNRAVNKLEQEEIKNELF